MMGLKYVFGTAVLAVVCAACEKDSAGELMREECDRIVFDTPALMVETVTRSTLKDALVPGDEFGMLGYCVPYTVGTQTIFSSTTVTNCPSGKICISFSICL